MVQRGASSERYVVGLVRCLGAGRDSRPQIGFNHIADVAEVSRRFPIAINDHRLILDEGAYPLGYDSGVGTVRILSRPKNIEVTQTDRPQAIATREHLGIDFGHVFRGPVGGEWVSNF